MDPQIFDKTDQYIADLFVEDDVALRTTLESVEKNNIPNISISATQGKLLQVLAKACNAKRILELGTLVGYSTIWLARSIPDDGALITIEYEEKHVALARQNINNAGLTHKVEIRTGKALDILPKLEQENAGPFDLIFIDADKPPYLEYFNWAIRLSRPGSIIVADNVIRAGKVLDPNSEDEAVKGVQRLNNFLAVCKEVTATIIQTVGTKEHDGMVIAFVNGK